MAQIVMPQVYHAERRMDTEYFEDKSDLSTGRQSLCFMRSEAARRDYLPFRVARP